LSDVATLGESVAAPVTYSAATATVIAGINLETWGLLISATGMLVGVVIGLCGLAMSYHFKKKHYNLAKDRRKGD
jgi:hypothetical protein